jgi:uncharacterized membrane protein YgaE (UPF0421/DUF939 family)
MTMVRVAIDHLFPPDPGSLRLLAALRATLAGVLTLLLVLLLGMFVVAPITDRILGFAIALFIAATVRDNDIRQKLVTISLGGLAAFASTALAALLLDQPFAAAAVVPVLMFVVVYSSIRGPRYASIGTVTLIGYIVGLVTRQPPETLPTRLLVIVLAAGVAALIHGVLLPERPLAELNRLRRAVRARIANVLDRIAAAVAAGAWTVALRAELEREIARLSETVMLAQARVARLATQLPGQGIPWLHLLEMDVAVERVSRIALQDLGTAEERSALLANLAALREAPDRPLPFPPGTGPLGSAIDLLGRVWRDIPHIELAHAAAPPSPAADLGWRPALQAAVAAALAIVCGELVSPRRWYWAAFAALVMFQGTRTRGESIVKGVRYVVGTTAGMVVGVLTATLLSGDELWSMVAVVIGVFLAFQANVAAYGVMVFWITIIFGLMFGMLGYFALDVLLLRLEESLVGAAAGALIACLVLVRREPAITQEAMLAFLGALRALIESASAVLLDGRPAPELAARILAAEQGFRDLKAIAQGQQSSLPVSHDETLRRRITLLEACEYWARELGSICLRTGRLTDPGLIDIARAAIARIDAHLRGLTAQLSAGSSAPRIANEATSDVVGATPDDPSHHAVRLLLRIDTALVRGALA